MDESLSLISGAYYRIQFQGILDQKWAEQFGDMQVFTTHASQNSRPPVTTVVGAVVDQAALTGLLNLAYSLGMPLLSVTYLGK